jgi:hypothetical protein
MQDSLRTLEAQVAARAAADADSTARMTALETEVAAMRGQIGGLGSAMEEVIMSFLVLSIALKPAGWWCLAPCPVSVCQHICHSVDVCALHTWHTEAAGYRWNTCQPAVQCVVCVC